jgi:hypothetical protein
MALLHNPRSVGRRTTQVIFMVRPLQKITSHSHMKLMHTALVAGVLAVAAHNASAAIAITEIDPYGSNKNSGYSSSGNEGGDWFKLTNTGTTAVSIAGWTMVDSHASSGGTISIANAGASAALTLANGVTTLAAGQSAVFIEWGDSAANSSAEIQQWEAAWFGAGKAPANLLIGTYNDTAKSNFGLSQTSDMVNIFSGGSNSSALVASVSFGADPSVTPMATFDNTAGLNNATLTQYSAVGVNGAFVSASGLEVGSPGVSAVPLPESNLLLLSGLGVMGVLVVGRRRGMFGF